VKNLSLVFLPEAEKDLARLDRAIRRRIINKLDWLLENFDIVIPEALTGEFRDFYKLRIGDWQYIRLIGRIIQLSSVTLTDGIRYTRKGE